MFSIETVKFTEVYDLGRGPDSDPVLLLNLHVLVHDPSPSVRFPAPQCNNPYCGTAGGCRPIIVVIGESSVSVAAAS